MERKHLNTIEEAEDLVRDLFQGIHRSNKFKAIATYPTDPLLFKLHSDTLAIIMKSLKQISASEDDTYLVLHLLYKIMKIICDTPNFKFDGVLDILSAYAQRQKFENLIYKSHSKLDSIVFKILDLFPANVLEGRLQGEKHQVSFHLVAKYYANKKQLKEYKAKVIPKLKEEFLVDKSKHLVRMAPYFGDAIDEKEYTELLQAGQKLFRRSENNFETVRILIAESPVDLSGVAHSIIFDTFKDYLPAKEEDKIQRLKNIVGLVSKNCKEEAQVEKIIESYAELIEQNNFEHVRGPAAVNLLILLTNYKQSSSNMASRVLGLALQCLSIISNEEFYNQIISQLDQINFSKYQSLTLSDKDLGTLKKVLTTATSNKNSFYICCQVLSNLMKINEEWPAEFTPIIEAVNTNYIVANMKTIGKLVTNYPHFTIAFLVTKQFLTKKDSAKLKNIKTDTMSLLNEDCFLNMAKYFIKVGSIDIKNWLNLLALCIPHYAEISNPGESKHNVLCSTLAQVIMHPKTKPSVVKEFFESTIENRDFVAYALLNGVMSKLYCNTEEKDYEKINFDRLQIFIKLMINDLPNYEELSEETVLRLLWLINCRSVSPTLALRSDLRRLLSTNTEFNTKFKEFLTEAYDTFKGYIISRDGLFNKKQLVSETTALLFANVIQIGGLVQLYDDIQFFISVDTYSHPSELDQYEEGESSATEFESELKLFEKQLNTLGFAQKPVSSSTKEETKSGDGGKKGAGKTGKGGKKGKGAPQKQEKIAVDREEFERQMLQALHERLIKYLKPVCSAFKCVMSLRNYELTKEFQGKCYNNIIELIKYKDVRGPIEEMIYHMFRYCPYKPVNKVADYLVQLYFNKMADITIDEVHKFEEKFSVCLKSLRELDFPNLDPTFSNIIYESCQYVLVREEFDTRLKGYALTLIIKIGTSGDSEALGEEILGMMIDNLDRVAVYKETQSLFNFLINKYGDSFFETLYSYVLDYADEAKNCTLNALLNTENKAALNTFDQFLRVKILSIDENQYISDVAVKVLQKFEYKPTKQDIEGFDICTFSNDENNESVEKLTKVMPELFETIPQSVDAFVKNSIQASKKILENPDIEDLELALQFLPNLAKYNVKFISKFVADILQVFIEDLCIEQYVSLLDKTVEIGIQIIQYHGAEQGQNLLKVLENYLDKKYSSQNNVTAIIYMGACAPYLKDKGKVKNICDKILSMSDSSSEHLQKNLAKCLPELINFFNNPEKIAAQLLENLNKTENMNEIRGSAYILAGFIKGLGVKTIEKLKIFDFLGQIIEEKKKETNRKYAIITLMNALTENLGKLFEPYFIQTLELLMNFFGDNNQEVRLASLRCTKTMMTFLSAYGVKRILPLLLKGIEEKTWRAKVASISVLGNMAYCAPKQLSTSLPQIVPNLAKALSDVHPAVCERGSQALAEIGSTIQSPEISDISDILIRALSNPYDENKKGLEVLLKTEFVHYIDTAALSLIMPTIEYGLRNRETAARLKGCQLVGTFTKLIKNPEDLEPYMSMLENALKVAIKDNLEKIRGLAASSYGVLCQKLGLERAAPLIVSVQEMLESKDSTSVDRAGAAEAMSEITNAMGKEYAQKVIPVFLANTKSNNNYIRESFIGIFAYLPRAMGEDFEPYIADVVENVIESVSEENETIRNLSIRVCKLLIHKFGLKETKTLIEPAEIGLFSNSWRKRASSVQLVNELIDTLRIAQRDEDLDAETKDHYETLFRRMITAIYILKFDDIEVVKNNATQIWKTFVDNTPKTLKTILTQLLDKILSLLQHPVTQHLGLNTIREFASKYMEPFYRDIFAYFTINREQKSANTKYLTALCIMMNNMLEVTNDEFLEGRREPVVAMIQELAITNDQFLRQSICQVFATTIKKCKKNDIKNDVIPAVFDELAELQETDSQYLDYLQFFNTIISEDIDHILEYLSPTLLITPFKQYQIDILLNNSEHFGPRIYYSGTFKDTIKLYVKEYLEGDYSDNLRQSILYCINQLSVNLNIEFVGNFFNDCYQLIETSNLKDHMSRIYLGLDLFAYYFSKTPHDYQQFLFQVLSNLNSYLIMEDTRLLDSINKIFGIIFNTMTEEQCFIQIKILIQAIEDILQLGTKREVKSVNAFNHPHGLDPYMNIMKNCIAFGPIEVCDQGLLLSQYIIQRTKKEALVPYTDRILGPLIRSGFYKYENKLKTSILQTIISFERKGISISYLTSTLRTLFLRTIADYNGDKPFLKVICNGLRYTIQHSKKHDYIMNYLAQRYEKEIHPDKKYGFLYCMYKLIKQVNEEFSSEAINRAIEITTKQTKFDLGDSKQKLIAKINGLILKTSGKDKQFQELKSKMGKSEGYNDNNFFEFCTMMAGFLYCEESVVEELGPEKIAESFLLAMRGLNVKNNVMFTLEFVNSLKKSKSKVKKEIATHLLKKANFSEMYKSLIGTDEVMEMLQKLG